AHRRDGHAEADREGLDALELVAGREPLLGDDVHDALRELARQRRAVLGRRHHASNLITRSLDLATVPTRCCETVTQAVPPGPFPSPPGSPRAAPRDGPGPAAG